MKKLMPHEEPDFFRSFSAVLSVASRKIAKDEKGNFRFKVIGNHPYARKSGTVEVINGNLRVYEAFGAESYRVTFDCDCREFDGQGCFAAKHHLKPIYEDEVTP